ncbi:hypothetical protein C8J57DRAFT_1474450 [Mycena rebaudengoi]|nr:hypothetical protein C8J57DRAFT_1474450 [Mycena rebaudengoi]
MGVCVRLRGDGRPRVVGLRGQSSGRDGYAASLFEWRSAPLERLRPNCGAFGSNEWSSTRTSRLNSATATRRRGYPTRSGSLIDYFPQKLSWTNVTRGVGAAPRVGLSTIVVTVRVPALPALVPAADTPLQRYISLDPVQWKRAIRVHSPICLGSTASSLILTMLFV